MADLTNVYRTMSSLAYKMDIAQERTHRIGVAVAREQHEVAGLRRAREPRSRQVRERHAYWAGQLLAHGEWED
jgi:hypothetical protein